MAILEQMGMSAAVNRILLWPHNLYQGWLASRTMEVSAYYVAGREVPAVYNGMATAATGCRARHSLYLRAVFISVDTVISRNNNNRWLRSGQSLMALYCGSGATRSQILSGHVAVGTPRFCAVLVLVVASSPM